MFGNSSDIYKYCLLWHTFPSIRQTQLTLTCSREDYGWSDLQPVKSRTRASYWAHFTDRYRWHTNPSLPRYILIIFWKLDLFLGTGLQLLGCNSGMRAAFCSQQVRAMMTGSGGRPKPGWHVLCLGPVPSCHPEHMGGDIVIHWLLTNNLSPFQTEKDQTGPGTKSIY